MASGKVSSAFSIIKLLSLGADLVYSARAMMLALGCIQALRCNSNVCPAGVATQDPMLMKGLNVTDKRRRVAHFHEQTLEAVAEMLGAMGVEHSSELRPWHILRRVRMNEIKNYSELYHYVEPGEFLHEPLATDYARAIRASSSQTFQHVS